MLYFAILLFLLSEPCWSLAGADALRAALAEAARAGRRTLRVDGAFVSVGYVEHLLAAGHADGAAGPVAQLTVEDLSLLEEYAGRGGATAEAASLRLQAREQWRNPLSGVGHKGFAIPFWNGYACTTGLMPGPNGACFRDKALGKAALGCSGKPKADMQHYASEHCACSACGGAAPFTIMGGSLGKHVGWTPFCHNRLIPHCMCGLVDNSIKDKKTCYDLW